MHVSALLADDHKGEAMRVYHRYQEEHERRDKKGLALAA